MLHPSLMTVELALAVGLLTYITAVLLYNWLFHPLRTYPGPFLWGITCIPWILSTRSGYIHLKLVELHSHYGGVVRVKPGYLSFTDVRAYQDIYLRQPKAKYAFSKEPQFYFPSPNGAYFLGGPDRDCHAHFRHLISRAFSEGAVYDQESALRSHANTMLRLLKYKQGSAVNLGTYMSRFAFDVFGVVGFGKSFNTLQSSENRGFVDHLFSLTKYRTLAMSLGDFPLLQSLLLFILPCDAIAKSRLLWSFTCERVHERLNARNENKKDILSFLEGDSNRPGLSLPDLEANGLALMFAGAETTAALLSAALTYLVKDFSRLQLLQREVDCHFDCIESISLRACSQLPYLNAVLEECLRLAPPVPIDLPRVVPEGGAPVCGRILPEDTIVGVSIFAASRDSRNFHHPTKFLPERWLNHNDFERLFEDLIGQEPQLAIDYEACVSKDCHSASQPFSLGQRGCIGQTMAWAEMRYALAVLIFEFNFEFAPGHEEIEWAAQRQYMTWEREPLMMKLCERQSS
ncbi:cytochrome P450 [Myriangium duriaei CBS 260.36]|uniref:Cytochrome P450 n=1 Tax=Myriangium duriaei CBS 260.36 TaxID=1168546 RepID=A0A9P4JBC9_9PEZI|nr:cytochrome P450 [Myriangium duriaei CBS 260.36]